MNFGNPGQFSHWNRRDQFVYANMYDRSHPKRRGRRQSPPPAGCMSMLLLLGAAGFLAVRLLRH